MAFQKNLITLAISIVLCCKISFAQSLINSTGASLQNASVILDYSIGEIGIATLQGNQQHATQGLLQPMKKEVNCRLLSLLPNAITPNADGKNDCFGAKNWPPTSSFELSVFNRWGQQLFKTNNINDCWDGAFNNYLQPTGAYIYFLRATNSVCGNISTQGTIMLIR